jgi:hypothetical protein
MAMFILLLGMTSVLGLLSFGAALARSSELRGKSASALDNIVADLRETLFPEVLAADGSVLAGEPVAIVDRPVPGHPALTYSAYPVREPGAEGALVPELYRVDIEIRWSSEGKTRAETYRTLMVREIPFGERLRRQFVESP